MEWNMLRASSFPHYPKPAKPEPNQVIDFLSTVNYLDLGLGEDPDPA